jgi:hypothetical protein
MQSLIVYFSQNKTKARHKQIYFNKLFINIEYKIIYINFSNVLY